MNTISDGTRQPKPGHISSGWGTEIFDVSAHVRRAFEGMPVGKALTIAEVWGRGMRQAIPESASLDLGVVAQIMQMIAEGRARVPGVVGNYDDQGRTIAYATEEIEYKDLPLKPGDEVVQAPEYQKGPFRYMIGVVEEADKDGLTVLWNDPQFGRSGGGFQHFAKLDALGKMFIEAYQLNGDKADEVEDRARELAISMIIDGGFDSSDSDLGGDATGGTVQTHLMIAFMRQPEMMDNIE